MSFGNRFGAMVIQTQEVALEAFVAVLKADHATCESTGFVPLRIYSKYNKTYIGLREDTTAAVKRAGMLFGTKCHVNKETIVILRIQFSFRGFTKYSTTMLGHDEGFRQMLYKVTYPTGYDTSADSCIWAFHGDLPLQERAEDGGILIASEWIEII
jgi:hypothetical protein